jgi:inhibitor of cysteine peptidase
MEVDEMANRTGLVWLGVLMAVAIMMSGCGGVVRGEAGNGGMPVDVGEPAGDGLAPIDEISVIIMESLPATAAVVARGHLADGCTHIVDMMMQIDEEAGLFRVTLGTYRDPEAMCTMALVPFEEVVELPIMGLPAGTYTVEVNGMTTTFELAVDNVLLEE